LIVWSQRATDELEEIAQFIALDSEHYSKAVVRTILRKTRRLGDFPYIGRVVPEFEDDSMREIFAYNYRILYKIKPDEIDIAAIIHGRRLLDLSLRP